MSAGEVIDAVAVARRVLETPEAIYSLTPLEAVALAGYVVQDVDGAVPHLVAPPSPEWRRLPASIAAAVASLLMADEALNDHKLAVLATGGEEPAFSQARADLRLALDAFNDALSDLRTRFEKEFPHG